MRNDKLLAVDLFSGAGGLSLGFLQTGQVQIVAAVENNKYAQKTYERNHKGVKIFDDIISLNDDKNNSLEQIINECNKFGRNRVDIVFGGPPCQGFSNANRQKTELISTNNQLVKEYVKTIEMLNPDAFVMENVKSMKSAKHKFFYSLEDKNFVENLGLNLIEEKIAIGKETELTEELILFLEKKILEKADLSKFILKDKNVFLRLRQLGRKEKDLSSYLVKVEIELERMFSRWEELHQELWSARYLEKWRLLREHIQNKGLELSDTDLIISFLKEIIEVQRILMRTNEIISNNIEIKDIVTINKIVYIQVQTYGVLDFLIAKFRELGYVLNENHLILNAANFGVPQLRERLFLIGVKSKFVAGEDIELPNPVIHHPDQFYTVKDAIKDLEDVTPYTVMDEDSPLEKSLLKNTNPLNEYLNGSVNTVRNHIMTETRQTALDRFKMLEPGQNFHNLDESYKQTYSNPGRTQNTVYQRLHYDKPSGTVLNVRKSMWIHPQKIRAISIREAARIQSFPDDFIFEGTKDSQYQQIGNAVPPLLGRAVAEQVLKYLGISEIELLAAIIKPRDKIPNI
ncbi:DNA cytosine methyltransferase [Paenibacillus xylanexedens]|uniref:DNA cytosine methyltransferase n=1 Tax=Paenibacillus xylanexedens TaxID=528191 RepID=UPI001C8D8463|nr:DNA cytosine methyltransferase [Paenibacillus xylanexedens]MBY0114552.1 DNA cytosine methyltransferase [Paenibacillus xylanexedens]